MVCLFTQSEEFSLCAILFTAVNRLLCSLEILAYARLSGVKTSTLHFEFEGFTANHDRKTERKYVK